MSTEAPFPQRPAPEDFDGKVIITWPPKREAVEGLPGWRITITDAESGEQINSVVRFGLVYADATDLIWTEAVALVDAEGHLLRDGAVPVTGEDGGVEAAVFRFLVTEMRVAEATK